MTDRPMDWKSLPFEPFTDTAEVLQRRLRNGDLTCVEVVETYLRVITTYNHKLRAVIQTGPEDDLLRRARQLDDECNKKIYRSLLHGVPVLVKVDKIRK